MKRITQVNNLQQSIIVMADGNPGAVRVCMELLKIDQTGFVDLCHLDDAEIYGSDIWLCYKDICGCDILLLREKIRDMKIKGDLLKLKNRVPS